MMTLQIVILFLDPKAILLQEQSVPDACCY